MKKFFSLVLALVMALSLTTIAWADVVPAGDYTFTSNTVDFDTTNDMSYVGSSSSTPYPAWIHYEGSADITIDLGGLTFTMPTGTVHVPVYIGGSGTVTITNGKIIGSAASRCIVAVGGTATVNFENVEIVSNRPNGSGVAIFQMKGFDTTVNLFDGAKISAVGSYATTESYGALNVYDGAVVSYDSTGSNGNGTGSAIGVSGGTGVANIYGGTISTNATGANKSAVSTNSSGGTINITGGTITGETAVRAITDSTYNNSAEINISGGTINGALAETTYGGTAIPEVTVSGGIFNTNPFDYLATDYETAAVGSTSDTFVVGQDIEVDANGKITAGTFNDDVSAYMAAGVTQTTTGVIVSSSTHTEFDTKDAKTLAVKGTKALTLIPAKGAYVATATGNWVGGWVKHYVDEYGVEYVPCTADVDGALIVYYKGTNSVYDTVVAANPFYEAVATEFTSFGTACGQLDNRADTTAKYYTYADGNGIVYLNKGTTATAKQVMVNGKLVGVEAANLIGNLNAHKWVVEKNAKNEVTKATCSLCGQQASWTLNLASVPTGATFVPAPGGGFLYWNAAPVVDTDTKVESAETFDAGIALYVGMSVMAAAGSAVVLKKRED